MFQLFELLISYQVFVVHGDCNDAVLLAVHSGYGITSLGLAICDIVRVLSTGVVQWLRRRSLAGGLSPPCSLSMVDR